MEKQSKHLYESIFILSKCVKTVTRIRPLLSVEKQSLRDAEDYFVLFQNMLILEATIFLEEYDHHFLRNSEKHHNDRIGQIKKIASPILRQIRKWDGIKLFRNRFIAHNWRTNQGAFVIPDLNEYNVPRNRFEAVLLIDYLNYVWSLISAEFQEEFDDVFKFVDTQKPPERAADDYSNLNSDLIKMASEVEIMCRVYGKKYFLKVLNYEFED